MSSRSRLLGHVGMHVSAKVDYAVRAVLELAGTSRQSPRKLREVAEAQAIRSPISRTYSLTCAPPGS